MRKPTTQQMIRELRPRDKPEVEIWETNSKRNFPHLSTIYLAGAGIAILASFGVLYRANGRSVDDWVTSPSVLLSILAVVARSLAEAGFKSGAEAFWWGKLVSEKGVTLGELHHTWEFSQDKIPLFRRHRSWNLVRAAALSALLLGAVGPLLQRSLAIEQITETSEQLVTLPVRVEPMWNLTLSDTNMRNGHTWSPAMYQPEFAQIVVEYTQRKQPRLASGRSFCDGTCTANITVAGFDVNCSEERRLPDGLPHLKTARLVFMGGEIRPCPMLPWSNLTEDLEESPESNSFCPFETYYELAVDLGPDGLRYASYVRTDPYNDSLLVQQCNFSTAFVTMTIDITDSASVAISSQYPLPQDRVIAPIGPPTIAVKDPSILGGFQQVMSDLYEGHVLWDNNEGSNLVQGSGPRLYANTTNLPGGKGMSKNWKLIVPFRSPLDDFTNTLNEMALRYALVDVPDDNADRVRLNEYYITTFKGDLRGNGSLPLPIPGGPATLSKSQTVTMVQSRPVVIFSANYIYATIATGIVVLSAVASGVLLYGWPGIGREFTPSPLEVAKAFDAPLLAGVPSGAKVEVVLRRMGRVKVRYGEVRTGGDAPGAPPVRVAGEADAEEALMVSSEPAGTEAEMEAGAVRERRRLVVDRWERVATPENGFRYTV